MKNIDGANTAKRQERVNILGIKIDKMAMQDVLESAGECIALRKPLLIGVVNVAKIVNMRKDDILRNSVEQADLVLADGLPIVWLSRAIGKPLLGRIAGIDIMIELLKEADKNHWRVYFLGAKPEVLELLVEKVKKDSPGLKIAGYRDGYFSAEQEQDVAAAIRHCNADILFVGINSPKKENFLSRWRHFMNVSVCHGVGGSFDVIAGVTKRAPVWMQKSGLEWLYRLIQEPRRMWKRYLVTNVVFTVMAISAIIKARFCRAALESSDAPSSNTKNCGGK